MRSGRRLRAPTYQVAVRQLAGLLVAITLFVTGFPNDTLAERRVALVIGNGAYVRDPLPNPPRDAALMAQTLARVGFDVIRVIDADRAKMQQALVAFGRKLAAKDAVGLFYYAGHGVQVSGDNYLLPIDIDIRTEAEVLLQGVNLKEILVTLAPQNARLAVAVLDACRNNPFVGLTRGLKRGLAPVSAPAGTLIAFSTAPGEVALDGEGQNSPYTAALAKAIPTPGLAIEEVFKRTRAGVMQATKRVQVPWEHSSLTGKFVFVPKPTVSPDGRDEIGATSSNLRIAEIEAWEQINRANDAAPYTAFLKQYPSGVFAELARHRIEQFGRQESSWNWWLPKIVTGTRPRGDKPENGRQQDARTAEELFERALRFEAEQKSPEDLSHAKTLYQAAAEKGLVPAMFRFARLIERQARAKRKAGGTKFALERQLKRSAEWYAKGAEKRHAGAMRALGTLHEFGEGVRRDMAEALRLYQTAAQAGDADAMTSLGFLYANGKGVARNAARARDWYQRAAAGGSVRAMFNLAIMLMSTDGGSVNLGAAARHLQMAADIGHAGAMRQLAVMYDQGRGIDRDPSAAATFLLKAFAAGDSSAKGDLLDGSRRWSRATRRAVQRRLQTAGHYRGAIHGVFNASTRRALAVYADAR